MKTKVSVWLMILGINLILSQTSKTTKGEENKRPNIIIILADDLGYSDLGCTGSEIKTPNLDKLANKGVLFTDFYNTSRCCPSRASLLTGQHQWDAGMGHMDYTKSDLPEYQGYLNKESITIAEALKLGGYQTFMSGKWHVGNKERDMWPDKRGFDQFYGVPAGGGLYFYPSKYYKRDVYWNGNKVQPDSTWYSTDAFTDYTINYIENDRNKEEPFFIYLAYIAPHYPLQAKEEDIQKYTGTYDEGYDAIRNNRFRKQKDIGLMSDDAVLPPLEVRSWENVKNKKKEARKMSVYAAMVDNMDQNIGRLISTLEKEGELDNTVIFFLSDNGACQSKFNKTPKVPIGSRNSNATYGDWYNVSNTPYRLHKKKEHEGGIKTPMIMHWPNGITKPKKISKPAHITDFMQTCLQLAQVEYPKSYNDILLDELDGCDLLPLLENEKAYEKRQFYWEHEGNKAIRVGDWKLVASKNKDWELYNLKKDPFELQNVALKYPNKKIDMEHKYQSWTQEHNVKPWPLQKQ